MAGARSKSGVEPSLSVTPLASKGTSGRFTVVEASGNSRGLGALGKLRKPYTRDGAQAAASTRRFEELRTIFLGAEHVGKKIVVTAF